MRPGEKKGRSYGDLEQLLAIATQTRLQAIQSQLAASFTLCATAEIEIRCGELDVARNLIDKLLHTIEVIRRHIEDRAHVPGNSVAHLRNQLAQLKQQIRKVEAQLRTK